MSTTSVSFFTPIRYSSQSICFEVSSRYTPSISISQGLRAWVDEYFYLRGDVACVISDRTTLNGSEAVVIEPGKAFGMHSLFKVMSYTAYFFNLLISTQFPMITAYRSVVQLQMILSSLPIFMLIAKVILRSTSRFHIDTEFKESEVGKNHHQLHETKDEYPIGLIPDQVKATLDKLFGGPGSVDCLPVYQGDPNKLDIDTMMDPIMKGIDIDPKSQKSNGFIAIKMRCLSSLEEVKQKFSYISKDVSEPMEDIVVLRQNFIEEPLAWVQDKGGRISAEFFKAIGPIGTGNFTFSENGELTDGQTEAFGLLQHLIKEGSGEDSNGLRWEIIGHQTQKI
jgi:hypothetical protein